MDLELIRQSVGFITKSINDYKHSLPQCNSFEPSQLDTIKSYIIINSVIQLSFASVPLKCVSARALFFAHSSQMVLLLRAPFHLELHWKAVKRMIIHSNDWNTNRWKHFVYLSFVEKCYSRKIDWERPKQQLNYLWFADNVFSMRRSGFSCTAHFFTTEYIVPFAFGYSYFHTIAS